MKINGIECVCGRVIDIEVREGKIVYLQVVNAPRCCGDKEATDSGSGGKHDK